MFLVQEAVDDYVGADNPVRFIGAFVDELDLAGAGFVGVEPKATGRPVYAPADLSKLYIYGYLNRVRSGPRPIYCAASCALSMAKVSLILYGGVISVGNDCIMIARANSTLGGRLAA